MRFILVSRNPQNYISLPQHWALIHIFEVINKINIYIYVCVYACIYACECMDIEKQLKSIECAYYSIHI